MADTKKPIRPKFTSPVGVAKFPALITPDNYEGTVKFKCNMELPERDMQALMAQVAAVEPEAKAEYEAAKAAAKAKGKPLKGEFDFLTPYVEIMDPANGEPTGMFFVKCTANASFKDSKGVEKSITIPMFDASGAEISRFKRPNLWSGSKVRISYQCIPYCNIAAKNYGVSLRLQAVKVIEARTGSGGNASDFGFGEAEEGYVAREDHDEENVTANAGDDADGADF